MYSVYFNSIKLLGTFAKGKGDTDTFFFTISCAVLLLCRDVVVLKQQRGIIHTPCKGYTLYVVYNCSKSQHSLRMGALCLSPVITPL